MTLARLAITVAVVSIGLMSCSSEEAAPTESTTAAQSSDTSVPPAPSTAPSTASGAVGVSPGGVTTSVDAGAESLEEEYFQACHTAKVWMDAQGGDAQALVEPYLASIQSTDSAGPGTFGTPWSQLTPGRQSAVIVAVEAAANALCG